METRGVQEHYWTSNTGGRKTEVVYRPYTQGVDGEQFFQGLIALCIIYFVARLFFDGLIAFLIVGLSITLIIQLLDGVSRTIRPKSFYGRGGSSRF